LAYAPFSVVVVRSWVASSAAIESISDFSRQQSPKASAKSGRSRRAVISAGA
jgi:hypothetical protein